MEAPTYPPARAFQPPAPVSYSTLSVQIVSLAELMSAPAAWAIVVKHAPVLQFITQAPSVKPYLTNMTFETFTTLGLVDPSAAAATDAELRTLPRSQWPAL